MINVLDGRGAVVVSAIVVGSIPARMNYLQMISQTQNLQMTSTNHWHLDIQHVL